MRCGAVQYERSAQAVGNGQGKASLARLDGWMAMLGALVGEGRRVGDRQW